MASTSHCRSFSKRLLRSTTRLGISEQAHISYHIRSQCLYKPICRYSSSAGAELLLEGGAAVAAAEHEPISAITAAATATKTKSPYRTAASMVVSRAPTLTRDLTEFEKAFFFYQKRLDKRLSLPFNQDFYFREGTIAKDEWIRKQKSLEKYDPRGYDAWKDELLIGEEPKADENMTFDELIKNTVTGEEITEHDTEEEIAAKKALDKPMSRQSKADLEGDEQSLNRRMSRTVYLLVQAKSIEGTVWRFPEVDLKGKENLSAASLRALFDSCGLNMNIWAVGNAPIGVYTQKFSDTYKARHPEETLIGRKVFFMKSRILAGQANVNDNTLSAKDFKWLVKEEIEKVVANDYWESIRHMLATR